MAAPTKPYDQNLVAARWSRPAGLSHYSMAASEERTITLYSVTDGVTVATDGGEVKVACMPAAVGAGAYNTVGGSYPQVRELRGMFHCLVLKAGAAAVEVEINTAAIKGLPVGKVTDVTVAEGTAEPHESAVT